MKVIKNKKRRRTINQVAVVAGGVLDDSFFPEIAACRYIIGTDRAAWRLISHGIVPDFALGDFDSVTLQQMAAIEKVCRVKKFPPEKDWTDLELGVRKAIELKMSHINIYGALGRRFDHALAAIGLLSLIEKSGIVGIIKDSYNEILLTSRRLEISQEPTFPYLSVIPVSETATITLEGFKYNAKKLKIVKPQTLGVSNEITAKKAIIIPHRGKVLVIRSRDFLVEQKGLKIYNNYKWRVARAVMERLAKP